MVISRAQGIYGVYCIEAQGLRSINAMHPEIKLIIKSLQETIILLYHLTLDI